MHWRLVSPLVPILACCWMVSCDGVARNQTPQQAQPRAKTEQTPLNAPSPPAVENEMDLEQAIQRNNIQHVNSILRKSPELATVEIKYQAPLRLAASLGHFEICRCLIEEHHVDVNDFDRGVGYPIITVALKHPKIVELLIANGADLKTPITWRGAGSGIHVIGLDATALHFAADGGVPETIRLLIDNGVDIYAVARDIDREKYSQNTALEVAAYAGEVENAAAIVNHSKFAAADPAVRQAELDHCLFIGAFSPFNESELERLKLVQLLLKKGANPNTTEDFDPTEYDRGITPLEAVVRDIDPENETNYDLIKQTAGLLQAHGAKMDIASAIATGDINEVQRQLEEHPELANSRRSDRYPVLHLAIRMGDKSIVKALLDAGCDVDIRNEAEYYGDRHGTALQWAASWERVELASLLIEAGADVNAVDRRGCTSLHEATEMGTAGMVKLLLERGANLDALNEDRDTPLDLCQKRHPERFEEMEALFREHKSRQGK